jgi:hypothetical protein
MVSCRYAPLQSRLAARVAARHVARGSLCNFVLREVKVITLASRQRWRTAGRQLDSEGAFAWRPLRCPYSGIQIIERLGGVVFLSPHFHFEDRGLHGSDSGEPPRRGDQLINEIPLDGVGGNEGIVIAIREGFELADAFVGKKDDVAPGEIVPVRVLAELCFPSGVLGPCDLAPLVLDASICLSLRKTYSGSKVRCAFLSDFVSAFVCNKRKL